jgi:hypothetical protein
MMRKATTLPSLICEDFCRANMPLLSGVVLLSMVDCSMVQFLPWKASSVYAESQGFASLSLLRWCLGTNTVQVTVSVLCQIIFLATSAGKDEPSTSGQAKALFAMNITFTVLGLVWGHTTLYTKGSLLSRLESEEGDGDKAEMAMADVANPMMMMTMATPAAAAAAAAGAGKISLGSDHDVDGGDVRARNSKLSEETAQLERKLNEALALISLAEHKRSQLEQDNARLKGVQGVAVL